MINQISNFFNKNYNEEQIKKLTNHLNITNFKANSMVNSEDLVDCGVILEKGAFVRRGVYGNWKEKFTPELEAEADAWIAENLKRIDLKFPLFTNNQS